MSGTNAHVVVEQYAPGDPAANTCFTSRQLVSNPASTANGASKPDAAASERLPGGPYLLPVSGKSVEAVQQLALAVADDLAARGGADALPASRASRPR